MANKIPDVFKIAFRPSVLSRFTPNQLTPTQKMQLARARIWTEIIGGNLRTGHRIARKPFKGPGMEDYFDYSFPEFIYPFKHVPDEFNDELDEFREIRNSRKGKSIVFNPERVFRDVPKHERNRFLFIEKKRQEREQKLNMPKKNKK
jgi:hypothetical protein